MFNWDMQGELNEHEKIVSVLREVDIVISTLAYPQVLDQLKIIDAIKVAGNIKVPNLSWKFWWGPCQLNFIKVYLQKENFSNSMYGGLYWFI